MNILSNLNIHVSDFGFEYTKLLPHCWQIINLIKPKSSHNFHSLFFSLRSYNRWIFIGKWREHAFNKWDPCRLKTLSTFVHYHFIYLSIYLSNCLFSSLSFASTTFAFDSSFLSASFDAQSNYIQQKDHLSCNTEKRDVKSDVEK